MAQRLEQYRCTTCGGHAVVLRGGAGVPWCCGEMMGLHAETAEEAADRKARTSATLPLRQCAQCGVTLVIFQPSAGALICCDTPMNPPAGEETDTPEPAAAVPPMEFNLTIPVKLVLDFMQRRQPSTTYFGINAQKNPLDFWVYQEMFWELRPDVIIEIGNAYGGALLAYAHLLDQLGNGRLIGVDIEHRAIAPATRAHPRVTLVTGDACEQYDNVCRLLRGNEKILVIEDSSHTYANTMNVLRTYCGLVTPGSYLIVEDSNCHHGVDIGPNPGPYEAIQDFIREHPEFEPDRARESFFITTNPMGYLRRKID